MKATVKGTTINIKSRRSSHDFHSARAISANKEKDKMIAQMEREAVALRQRIILGTEE